MNKREALITLRNFGIVTTTIAAAPWLLSGCGDGSNGSGNGGEARTPEVSLQDSLAFLSNEIRANPNLSSLYEYGDARIMRFVGHAYNAYVRITGSGTKVSELQNATWLGDNHDIQQIYANRVYGAPTSEPIAHLGKTYPFDPSLKSKPYVNKIIINRGAQVFNAGGTTATGGSSVLSFLAEMATHEPLHYDTPINDIDKTLTASSIYHYTHTSGLALYGDNLTTGEKVINFGTLDELATRYVHRKIIAAQFPELQSNYRQGEIEWTDLVSNNILSPLGYDTPQKILQLQRGGGFVELLGSLTRFTGGSENDAYLQLVDLNNKMYYGTGGLSYNESPKDGLSLIST